MVSRSSTDCHSTVSNEENPRSLRKVSVGWNLVTVLLPNLTVDHPNQNPSIKFCSSKFGYSRRVEETLQTDLSQTAMNVVLAENGAFHIVSVYYQEYILKAFTGWVLFLSGLQISISVTLRHLK